MTFVELQEKWSQVRAGVEGELNKVYGLLSSADDGQVRSKSLSVQWAVERPLPLHRVLMAFHIGFPTPVFQMGGLRSRNTTAIPKAVPSR